MLLRADNRTPDGRRFKPAVSGYESRPSVEGRAGRRPDGAGATAGRVALSKEG